MTTCRPLSPTSRTLVRCWIAPARNRTGSDGSPRTCSISLASTPGSSCAPSRSNSGELSRAVMAEFELGTTERGIALRLEDHGTAVWALGDPGSVARILRILLDNALRISPPQSELVIELRARRWRS